MAGTQVLKIHKSFAVMSVCWGANDFGKGQYRFKAECLDFSHTYRVRSCESNKLFGRHAKMEFGLVDESLCENVTTWALLIFSFAGALLELYIVCSNRFWRPE